MSDNSVIKANNLEIERLNREVSVLITTQSVFAQKLSGHSNLTGNEVEALNKEYIDVEDAIAVVRRKARDYQVANGMLKNLSK